MLEIRNKLAVASIWASAVIGLGCDRKEASMPEQERPAVAVSRYPRGSADLLSVVGNATKRLDPTVGQASEIVKPARPCLVIVHIRKFHTTGDLDSQLPRSLVDSLEKIQGSIYDILPQLSGDCHVNGIYRDGFDNEEKQNHEFLFDVAKKLDAIALENKKTSEDIVEFLNERLNDPDPEKQSMGKTLLKPYLLHLQLLKRDATYRLAYEGKIRIALTEDGKWDKVISRFIDENPEEVFNNSPRWQDIREEREGEIVARIYRDGSGVALLTLGDNHSLENNIRSWNSKNPDNQIGLIEIVPDGLRECRDLVRQFKQQKNEKETGLQRA